MLLRVKLKSCNVNDDLGLSRLIFAWLVILQ